MSAIIYHPKGIYITHRSNNNNFYLHLCLPELKHISLILLMNSFRLRYLVRDQEVQNKSAHYLPLFSQMKQKRPSYKWDYNALSLVLVTEVLIQHPVLISVDLCVFYLLYWDFSPLKVVKNMIQNIDVYKIRAVAGQHARLLLTFVKHKAKHEQ